jgi:hypothetical protein
VKVDHLGRRSIRGIHRKCTWDAAALQHMMVDHI